MSAKESVSKCSTLLLKQTNIKFVIFGTVFHKCGMLVCANNLQFRFIFIFVLYHLHGTYINVTLIKILL